MNDEDLIRALKKARVSRMHFALLVEHVDGKLIVSENKIPANVIKSIKMASPVRLTVTGTVYEANGQLVFQVSKAAPATLPNILKKIIRLQTGKTVNVELHLVADEQDE